jgi:hypothetical protein
MGKYNKLGKGLIRKKKSSFGKRIIIILWYIVPSLFMLSLALNAIFISRAIENKKKAKNKIHQISTDQPVKVKNDSIILKIIIDE